MIFMDVLMMFMPPLFLPATRVTIFAGKSVKLKSIRYGLISAS